MPAGNDFCNNELLNAVAHLVDGTVVDGDGRPVLRGIPRVGKFVYRTDRDTLEVCTGITPDATRDGGGTWEPVRGTGRWVDISDDVMLVDGSTETNISSVRVYACTNGSVVNILGRFNSDGDYGSDFFGSLRIPFELAYVPAATTYVGFMCGRYSSSDGEGYLQIVSTRLADYPTTGLYGARLTFQMDAGAGAQVFSGSYLTTWVFNACVFLA